MIDLHISQINEVFLKIECNEGIACELSDDFSYQAKNWHHGSHKHWNGILRLFNLRNHYIYAGLINKILMWADAKKYTTDWHPSAKAPKVLKDWYATLDLPFPVADDQDKILWQALMQERATIIAPTGSGKSLLAYLLTRYYNTKTLIIVPTINLLIQLKNDFLSYGENEENIKLIGDENKIDDEKIKISTSPQINIACWQSLVDQPKEFFQDFGLVIGDEAHGFKAKSLKKIMESMVNTLYRFALTATLANKNAEVDEMVIEGLFGPVIQGPSTQELIQKERLAELEIYCIILQYPDNERKKHRADSIHDETNFLVSYAPRQQFIANLATSLKGSSFVLHRLVKEHGPELYRLIKAVRGENSHMVNGETDADIREAVRLTADNNPETLVVASYGVFAGGVNVPNLRNAIFASPYKAQIRVLQSIGRTLRRTPTKPKATIYDVIDDLSWKGHQNYAIRHYLERLKLYYREFSDMKVKIITVPL